MKKLIPIIIIALTFFLSISMKVKTVEIEEPQSVVMNDQLGVVEESVDQGI